MSSPATELPADVQAVLTQLFDETARALDDGDAALARSLCSTARTVSENKVPSGEHKRTLLRGCDRVCAVLEGTANEAARQHLAAAYCNTLLATVQPEGE